MVQDVLRERDLVVAKCSTIPESRGDGCSRDRGGAVPPPAPPPAPAAAAARTVAPKANWLATSPNSVGCSQSAEPPWGRDLQSKKQQHWPPLLLASYSGDAATVREILEQGDCDVNASAVGGGQKTALYYAVQFNNIEVIQLLLEHPDIDPHKEMKTGGGNVTTPLQAAMEMGSQFPVYRAFLAKGWITEEDEAGGEEHEPEPLPDKDWHQPEPLPDKDWNQAEPLPDKDWNQAEPLPVKEWNQAEEASPVKDWNQTEAVPMPELIKVEDEDDDEEEAEELPWNSNSDESSWWPLGAQPVVSDGSSTRPSRSRTPPHPSHSRSRHRVHTTPPARAPWRPPRLRNAEATSASSAYDGRLPVSFPSTAMSGTMSNY